MPIVIGVLSLLCFPFWLAGLPRIFGEIINWVFSLGTESDAHFVLLARIWGSVSIVVAVTLTCLQTYDILEKAQTAIVALLLLSLAAATLASRPDWLEALFGTFLPIVPDYEPWIRTKFSKIAERPPWVEITVYLGAIGGGTYDYIGYIGCLREKAWGAIGQTFGRTPFCSQCLYDLRGSVAVGSQKCPECGASITDAYYESEASPKFDMSPENLRRAHRWLLPAKIDTGISFLSVLIFTVCFVVLGASILHPAQQVPAGRELLSHQAEFLTRFHPSLLYLYQIGIFMAFWGTIYGAFELYVRTTYECIAPLSRRLRALPIRKVRVPVLLYCGLGGMVLLWTFDDPIKLVTPAAIIGGVFTCGLWCFAMIWADRHFLPGPLRMGRMLLFLTAIAGTVLTALGIKGLWDYISSLLS